MLRSKLSKPKKALLYLSGIFAFLILAAALLLHSPWARSQASRYAAEAKQLESSDEHNALVRYRMAAVLDSHNSSYQNSIANIYLKRQQPDAAINALRELPRGEGIPRIASIQLAQQRYDDAIRTLNGVFGPVAAVTRAKCYSEMGEGSKALSALASATGDEAAVLQAAIELSEERATSGRSVSSPQAVKAVQRMRTNKLAVAQELYARGLLRTAGRVLKAIPDESSEKYLLLANINLAIMPATSSQLEIAKTAATGGVHLDPSNRALHIILRDVDRKLGKTDEATKEEALIKLLIK